MNSIVNICLCFSYFSFHFYENIFMLENFVAFWESFHFFKCHTLQINVVLHIFLVLKIKKLIIYSIISFAKIKVIINIFPNFLIKDKNSFDNIFNFQGNSTSYHIFLNIWISILCLMLNKRYDRRIHIFLFNIIQRLRMETVTRVTSETFMAKK